MKKIKNWFKKIWAHIRYGRNIGVIHWGDGNKDYQKNEYTDHLFDYPVILLDKNDYHRGEIIINNEALNPDYISEITSDIDYEREIWIKLQSGKRKKITLKGIEPTIINLKE